MADGAYELLPDDVEPVRDRLLERALGRLMLVWPVMEHNVEVMIWSLLKVSASEGMHLTTRMDIGTRCDLLTATAKRIADSKLKAKITANAKQIKEMLPARNDMMHGLWVRERTGATYVVSLRRAKDGRIYPRRITTKFVLAHVHDSISISKALAAASRMLEARR